MSTSTPTLTPDELYEVYTEEVRIEEEREKARIASLVNPCSSEESNRIMRELAIKGQAELPNETVRNRFVEWFNARSTKMKVYRGWTNREISMSICR
jgi:hypothetical protein